MFSDRPIEDLSIIKWVKENQAVSEYVEFFDESGDEEKLEKFAIKKGKYIDQLQSQIKQLEVMKANTLSSIDKIREEAFVPPGMPIFDEQERNLDVRKLIFLHRSSHNTEIELNIECYHFYVEKIHQCKVLIDLMEGNVIPPNFVCKVFEVFFMIMFSKSIQKLQFQFAALNISYNELEKTIINYKKPEWYDDFPGFMHNILSKSVTHLDETISYVPPLAYELSLSRYCFSGLSNIDSIIDELISTVTTVPTREFAKNILDISLSFIPELDTFSAPEQSVGLLMFYRIIFDRLYEKNNEFLFKSNKEECHRMMKLSSVPCSSFSLPENCSPLHSDDESIGEIFSRDCYYRSASKFLEGMIYITNPIDCLYAVHKTLLSINKAALMQRMKDKEVSLEDLNQILCFDDIFVLFLGVYLSSDVCGFSVITDFILRFSPDFCLSNSFEYAQASLESLTRHLTSINPEELT